MIYLGNRYAIVYTTVL